MKLEMNRKKKTLVILAIFIAVALIATFWAMGRQRGFPWNLMLKERWNLTDEQIKEIQQLVEDMRKSGASWKDIKAAVDAKLREWNIKPPPHADIELFYTIKTVVSTVNIMLATFLLVTHIQIYYKTKSEFTVRLIIFSLLLLLYTLTSNPVIYWIFGFRAFGLGPFAMLPDLFTCIALSILLYLSFK